MVKIAAALICIVGLLLTLAVSAVAETLQVISVLPGVYAEINVTRAERGLRQVEVSPALEDLARVYAAIIADDGEWNETVHFLMPVEWKEHKLQLFMGKHLDYYVLPQRGTTEVWELCAYWELPEPPRPDSVAHAFDTSAHHAPWLYHAEAHHIGMALCTDNVKDDEGLIKYFLVVYLTGK